MNKTGLQLLNARTHSMKNSAWNYIAFPPLFPIRFFTPPSYSLAQYCYHAETIFPLPPPAASKELTIAMFFLWNMNVHRVINCDDCRRNGVYIQMVEILKYLLTSVQTLETVVCLSTASLLVILEENSR
jgi:hypothetical protein